MRQINVALAQVKCSLSNKEENVRRIIECIESAGRKQADYILFPELYTSGSFMHENIVHLAEPLKGKTITEICKYAQKHNVGVVLGFPEIENAKLFNTAVLISKQGEIIGTYRKIHLFEIEKNIFEPGVDCPVFKLPEGKVGIMISYDIEFPEVARILAIKGAQFILVLGANKFPSHPYQDVYLKARALENHVFVAMANKVGLESNALFVGESSLIHPLGKTIHKCSNNEELPVLSINIEETDIARGNLDYLKNRRPTLYAKEDNHYT
ncbi:carbon-nitrogen hydrolase family protein [Aneurinibacillus migulanus]|uniref:Carbon-nitrogen hydrolase n=1 Tax=Aneurinibacillus migulanus TaxID=47500 RepID=A0A0D1YJ39_ANEMI|nr:carbon-nitrogen hydrolase family protein [Aneurinibacillus migulanus]KIV58802.1 carbon-nitrogen hydrolase [Aneurinibacillus migulanus]KON96493.1 carbon-nitrogen hydrolase [Aneurinibacillus migulanus]MED0892458.1 carbon-nitrogen hydrolase family protein [Aneurinibacillus migulanus]MED1615589.1 carbon-nitrogen hydrolase family protein [Aneurinibacillus migulanus]SDI18447.1 Predicted amidohydrolase [Aneurinibacillus migulanus]